VGYPDWRFQPETNGYTEGNSVGSRPPSVVTEGDILPHVSPAFHAIVDLLRHHDVLALSVLIFLEEMGIPLPLPGNFLLMYLGMQASHSRLNAGQVVVMMTLASTLGSIVLYCIAERVGRPALLRWGRYLGLEQKRVARIETWLARYGSATIGIGRLVPGLRTPTSAVGGIFDIPFRIFIPFTALAGFLWTAFWLVMGSILGRQLHLERFASGSHLVGTFIVAGACLLVLPAIGFFNAWRERRRERASQEEAVASCDASLDATGRPPDGDASERGAPVEANSAPASRWPAR
jgi:membrane protein DedA with SNARE-associated domain